MEAKDKWVNSILESSVGMKKVVPNDNLLSKITSRINAEQPIPTLTRWMVAASIALLISLNVALVSQENNTNDTNPVSTLVNISTNQLY